jgi:hypothetical protein
MEHKIFSFKRMYAIYFIHLIILFGFAVSCFGGKIEEFSADQVIIDPSGNTEQAGKLYVATDKVRMERPSFTGQGSMVMIFRKDLKMLRIIMPEAKAYVENPLNEADLQKALQQLPAGMKEEDLGRETINGFDCKKKRFEGSMEVSQGRRQTFHSIVWISDQIDFPIRAQGEDGHITELRNIKTGPQPEDLFEVPSGYSKAANLFGTMGGSPGGSEN